MTVKCSWCGVEQGSQIATKTEEISHTICSQCELKMSATMPVHKGWHFEVYNPQTSNEWIVLFDIDGDHLTAAEELRNELNIINAPIILRIAPTTGVLAGRVFNGLLSRS